MVFAPRVPILVFSAPKRLWVPSSNLAGPLRICSKLPVVPTLIRVPLGSTGLGVAIPQWKPRPGASVARAKGEPIITPSAPQAIHLQISPPVTKPPSAITGIYLPVCWKNSSLAAAQSATAVACGTPTPSTPREVQAAPGPIPTSTAAAPACINSSVIS